VIFSGHLAHFQSGGLEIYGLLFAVGGAIASSFGHIIAKYAQMRGADVIQNCLYSMTYGVGWWGLFVLLSGESLTFEMSPSYISALLYLAVVGSTLAFIFFLILLRNIGPGRASYVFIISPVVALVVSSVMEGYVWSETLIIGLVFVMVGNILMLRRRS
jgi:drug/metabolite transporter (DMT)-like permease